MKVVKVDRSKCRFRGLYMTAVEAVFFADWFRECEHCGEVFEPSRPDQRFCSHRCSNAAAQRRHVKRERERAAL